MRTLTLETGGKPTCVEIAGSGSPILIIGGAVPTLWADGLRDQLVTAGHEVINFDYRADRPVDPVGRTSLAQVNDALDVMEAAELAAPTVLGYSRGAVTAYALAHAFPDRVDRLVLLTPVAPFAEFLTDEPAPDLPEDPAELLERFAQELFSAAYLEARGEEARRFMLTMSSSSAHVARVTRQQEDPLPDDAMVTAPTLLIVAGADETVSGANADRLQAVLRSSTRINLAGASHAVPVEEPDRVAALVHDFASAA